MKEQLLAKKEMRYQIWINWIEQLKSKEKNIEMPEEMDQKITRISNYSTESLLTLNENKQKKRFSYLEVFNLSEALEETVKGILLDFPDKFGMFVIQSVFKNVLDIAEKNSLMVVEFLRFCSENEKVKNDQENLNLIVNLICSFKSNENFYAKEIIKEPRKIPVVSIYNISQIIELIITSWVPILDYLECNYRKRFVSQLDWVFSNQKFEKLLFLINSLSNFSENKQKLEKEINFLNNQKMTHFSMTQENFAEKKFSDEKENDDSTDQQNSNSILDSSSRNATLISSSENKLNLSSISNLSDEREVEISNIKTQISHLTNSQLQLQQQIKALAEKLQLVNSEKQKLEINLNLLLNNPSSPLIYRNSSPNLVDDNINNNNNNDINFIINNNNLINFNNNVLTDSPKFISTPRLIKNVHSPTVYSDTNNKITFIDSQIEKILLK